MNLFVLTLLFDTIRYYDNVIWKDASTDIKDEVKKIVSKTHIDNMRNLNASLVEGNGSITANIINLETNEIELYLEVVINKNCTSKVLFTYKGETYGLNKINHRN